MSPDNPPNPLPNNARSFLGHTLPRVLALTVLLYTFLVSIGLLGKAFKLYGGGFVDGLIASASNPGGNRSRRASARTVAKDWA